MPRNKLTYEDVKKFFEDKGYTLVSTTYVNSKEKLETLCPQGHTYYVTYSFFRMKLRPGRCQHTDCKRDHPQRLKYEDVKNYIESMGYILLSKTYVNTRVQLEMVCPEGHICEIKYNNFKYDGVRCADDRCIQKRKSETCRRNCGYDYPMQCPEILEKSMATWRETFNLEDFIAKLEKTCMERFGYPYSVQSPVVKAKRIATCREKYGVDYVSQNPEIHMKAMKSAFNLKDYEFPSGRMVKVQGFENLCLDYLLENGIPENEIIVSHDGGVPNLQYYNVDQKLSIYFPDMYIPNGNTIIEVKSDYTYLVNKENNLLKFDAVIQNGYNLYVYIFDTNKILIDILLSCDESDNKLVSLKGWAF